MNKTDTLRFLRHHLRHTVPKLLLFYLLLPAGILCLLAQAIRTALQASGAAAYPILLAALAAVGGNWGAYRIIRKKPPSLLVFAHGILCLLAVVVIAHESFPSEDAMTATMAVIGGCLTLAFMLILSFWLASRQAKAAHSAAVVLWVILFLILCAMVLQVARDIESRIVDLDTWVTILGIAGLILGACMPAILASARRKASRNRRTGLTEGRILQMVGETYLDRDDDLATRHYARVRYEVQGTEYETRASIAGVTLRRFGRKAFVGSRIPVFFDPANPADAQADKINRHFFDLQPEQLTEGNGEEGQGTASEERVSPENGNDTSRTESKRE